MKSIHSELVSIDLATAINQTVEDLFPRFTKNKVLIVTIRMTAEHYKGGPKVSKEFQLLFYRPHNYTFVGLYDNSNPIPTNPRIQTIVEYLSFHDTCWTNDGTEHCIRTIAQKVADQFKDINDADESVYVYNHFGFGGYKIYDAIIQTNSNDRIATFVPIEKKNTEVTDKDIETASQDHNDSDRTDQTNVVYGATDPTNIAYYDGYEDGFVKGANWMKKKTE